MTNKDIQQRKRAYHFLIGLHVFVVVLLLPVVTIPSYPQTPLQWQIFNFITENLYITIGLKGDMPFFTVFASLYITVLMFIVGCIMLIRFLCRVGISKEFQNIIYQHFFEKTIESDWEKRWLKTPIRKKIYLSFIMLMCSVMGLFHFTMDDIAAPLTNQSSLVVLGYHYRLGVIFWESVMSLFLVFPLFYFFVLMIYIFNLMRGVRREVVQPIIIQNQNLKNRTKRNNRKKNKK